MKHRVWLLLLMLLIVGYAPFVGSTTKNVDITVTSGDTSPSSSDEEFVGPFSSWMCARTAASGTCGTAAASFCNAAGNGATDDTAAVQSCIDSLGTTRSVIYFPCGIYNISTTLTITKSQVGLIGQDNSTAGGHCTTTLKWTGSNGGKLIYINGTLFSQLARLTFDGNHLANILVDQSYDGVTGSFDTTNQYIDDVFMNGNDVTTSYGMMCGGLSLGCSEVNILRSTFDTLGFAVATCNANALDMWIWYSSFSNTKVSVSGDSYLYLGNGCGGGAFHVLGSLFSGASEHDIGTGGAGDIVNIIDNYSSGSRQFVKNFGLSTLQRNIVLNTNVGATASIANTNFMMLLDNIIQNLNTTAPYIDGAIQLSLGNRFTNSSPFIGTAHLYAFGDQVIPYAPPAVPIRPQIPVNNGRTIYEATVGGSGTVCNAASPCSVQTAICKASNGPSSVFSGGSCTGSSDGLKSVAHLAPGLYPVSSTIVVPANSNVQIIGDGWNSSLRSTTANPILLINGPSRAVLRSFQVYGGSGNTANDGIHINGADQVGAYVYLRGNRLGVSARSLELANLDNVYVQADNFQMPFNYTATDWITHNGRSRFNQFFGTAGAITLSGAASAQMIGPWLEGNNVQSNISGTGTFTLSTAQMAGPADNTFYALNNFTGAFALLNVMNTPNSCPQTVAPITATGSGSGGLIVVALDKLASTSPISNTSGAASEFFGNFGNFGVGCVSPEQFLPDLPSPPTLSAIAPALRQFRNNKPMIPYNTIAGVTGLQLYDMDVEGLNIDMKILP